MAVSRSILLLAALALASGFAHAETNRSLSDHFNAKQLRTGRFHYRDLEKGADIGSSDITIRKGSRPDTFIYTNQVSGRFSQQWEAVAGSHFEPISVNLSFDDGDARHVTLDLKYTTQHVTGDFLPRNSRETLKVNKDLSPDTIDQRLDWAAAISQTDLIPGHKCTFHVFDAATGDSPVTVQVEGLETVEVPAGTFRAMRIAYRVEKSSGPETYVVLTNASGPRMLLKEEFPNGSVTELTSVQN
jgi:hypothetical protein